MHNTLYDKNKLILRNSLKSLCPLIIIFGLKYCIKIKLFSLVTVVIHKIPVWFRCCFHQQCIHIHIRFQTIEQFFVCFSIINATHLIFTASMSDLPGYKITSLICNRVSPNSFHLDFPILYAANCAGLLESLIVLIFQYSSYIQFFHVCSVFFVFLLGLHFIPFLLLLSFLLPFFRSVPLPGSFLSLLFSIIP